MTADEVNADLRRQLAEAIEASAAMRRLMERQGHQLDRMQSQLERALGEIAALRKLLDRGCRLVVGGRVDANGAFRVWDACALVAEFAELFGLLTEADFRADVSSTELRRK